MSVPPARRFFIASGCPIATTTLYRCVHLREQLEALGYEATVAEWFSEEKIEPEAALACEVIVLYRLPFCPALENLIERAHKSGKRVIFDTDDLVFAPELTHWHRGVALLPEDDRRLHEEGVQRYLETLRACDATMTATPLLAELAAREGRPAVVHRNALGQEMRELAEQLYHSRESRATADRVVIGYGSGTATHDVDFEEAAPALERILERYPQAELWIAGPLTLPDSLGRFGPRLRRFPLTDWRGWFQLMSQMDIALAPLEMGNIFCRAKSEIKFVEAGALGLPVVASRIDPFIEAMTEGVDGFLAANDEEWERALGQLIERAELRRKTGKEARRTVLQSYSPEVRSRELSQILPGLTKPLKLNWLIPEPFPGAGGDTGIFRIIRYLAEFGHDCHVYVVAYNLMNDFSDEEVRSYVRKHFGETRAHYERWRDTVRDADATFATFWPTVENLLTLPNGGERYYLVQDFEPNFYPDEPHHAERAEATYRSGLRCITLGPWLTKRLRADYGARADFFDFAVDTQVYWPRPGLRGHRRVCFYGRPATPRRAYALGLKAFRLLHERMPEVEINFFGAPELDPAPSFPVVQHGQLGEQELATLFSSCEVGVVFSLTNPSFVPLEMIACGCAVVEIASERWEGVLSHGKSAWLVQPTPEAVVDGIVELLQNDALRERLVKNNRQRSWRDSARQVEAILLRDDFLRTLPSQRFEPLRYGLGAWTEYIFFAYDLVAQLRPRLLVELGTDRGESYFAFCQSARENGTGTRAFAIDHWQGDSHVGSYDDTTFAEVSAHNLKYYREFSTLLRSSFDEALERFAPESIDLLHLDGHHTEEAARHDVEWWLPKLRPGGILLLHDVAVRGRDFGVWKVWAELRKRGRAFAFAGPPGLGIWEKPGAAVQPPWLEILLAGPNEQSNPYEERNRALQARMAQEWRDGTIRQAPLAGETVIQVFWKTEGGYSEEQSVDARIGHAKWKEVALPLGSVAPISGIRIDFFSALTQVEVSLIAVGDSYEAKAASAFAAISLGGDCVRVSREPFVIQITGIDPQLYLPEFTPALEGAELVVRMRLRVLR